MGTEKKQKKPKAKEEGRAEENWIDLRISKRYSHTFLTQSCTIVRSIFDNIHIGQFTITANMNV